MQNFPSPEKTISKFGHLTKIPYLCSGIRCEDRMKTNKNPIIIMIPENDLEVATEGGTFVSVTGGTIETAMPGTFVSAAGGTFETVLGGTIKPLPSYSVSRNKIYQG